MSDIADRDGQIVPLAVGGLSPHAEFTGEGFGIDARTLGGIQRLGVEAVGAYVGAAHEGGADGDGCLAFRTDESRVGGIEGAGDADALTVVPAHEAAAVYGIVRGEQATVVDAVRDVQRTCGHTHDAAVAAVAASAAVDDGAHLAVGDGRRAAGRTHQTCGAHPVGIDVAGHLQVADGGTVDVAERGAELLAVGC